MYKYLTLFILIGISFYGHAQEKIFYDNKWQKTKERNASQYRIITPQQQGIYKVEDYYMNGQLHRLTYQTDTNSTNPKYRVGSVISYDINGHKIREGQYQDGKRIGRWTYYYRNSSVEHETYYLNGTDTTLRYDSATHVLVSLGAGQSLPTTLNWDFKDGDTTYTETDSKHRKSVSMRIHKKDTLITVRTVNNGDIVETCYSAGNIIPCPVGNTKTYRVEFPFLTTGIPQFLTTHINYPLLAQKQKIQGRVIVRFQVEDDGAVSDIVLVKGIGSGCNEEAMRVIDIMPYWQPALQNGIPVCVPFTLPIAFKL